MSNEYEKKKASLLIKLDIAYTFIDCKVLLMLVMTAKFWRETWLLAGIYRGRQVSASHLLNKIWYSAVAPYLIFIPLAILADIGIQSWKRRLIHD